MTKSQEFIKKYAKALETGADFYNFDSCIPKPELAEGKRKFLLILPTPAITKSVSATVSVIVDMFAEEMPGWYIDVAYLPTAKDLQIYDKCNMPYCIGQQLHLDASHYDMVGFSISVLHEVLTTPVIMKSFSRCDKPIPLSWTERKDTKLGEYPLFMCGGITAAHGDIMFGELGDGRQSYLDFMCLGLCDTTKWVCEEMDKEWQGETNQDFINHCMEKFDFFYHPQAYKVVYKDNLIVENTKINPHAQDWVRPYYPKFIPPRLGAGRTFTQANGANAGDTQVQISEACVSGDTYVLTTKGYKTIKEIYETLEEGHVAITPTGRHRITNAWDKGEKETLVLTFPNGKVLELTPDHKVFNGKDYVPVVEMLKSEFYIPAGLEECDPKQDYYFDEEGVEKLCDFDIDCLYTTVKVQAKSCRAIDGWHLDCNKNQAKTALDAYYTWYNLTNEFPEKGRQIPQTLELNLLNELAGNFGRKKIKEGFYKTRVKSVTKSKAHVYDIEVEDCHVFVANGILVHNCTGGASSCFFCSEGNYSGAWVEDSMDVIRKHVREAKKWSAAVSCKPMSFNINHMSDFTELIYFMNESFPKVTYLNMRLEELARDPDAFRMMKATGASRISAPIEGLSQRIRNGFMNKNLSQEAIEKLFDFLIGQGVSDIKVGLVWSAFETEEDWKEIRELIARLKAKAASLNKKLPFRLKATALVYYPGTPLEYAARRTSEISYKGERYFNDEMYERNKEAGIHIRINGFRGSTFIEQAIVDLGGSLTQWVQDHIVAQGVVCYNMHPIATEENLPSFKALITAPEKYFSFRDPDCYISPMHRIRLALEGGIAYGVRKLQAGGWLSENAENATEKEPTGKCLYTYAGCKTKCFKKSLKSKPLIKYADVQIKDGHLVGTNPQIIEGCEYCETGKEVVEKHTKRQWSHNFSVDDLQAQVVTRSQFKYRFVLRRLKDYAMLNPHNTAFNAMACLLRQSDVVLDNYWNLTDHSLYNQMDPELACEVSGIQIVDVVFKSEITSEIEEAMAKANKELTTVKFVGVKEIHMDEKLSVNDYNIYKFKATGIPAEAFFTGSRSYSGAVRVLAKVDMQPKVTQTVDKTLTYPYFKVTSDGVVGTFALPRRYNPYLFFQEVLAEKKLTQKAIQQAVEFEIVAVGQTNSYAMCKCGKPILQSAIGGQSYGKCPQCLAKALMKKL